MSYEQSIEFLFKFAWKLGKLNEFNDVIFECLDLDESELSKCADKMILFFKE